MLQIDDQTYRDLVALARQNISQLTEQQKAAEKEAKLTGILAQYLRAKEPTSGRVIAADNLHSKAHSTYLAFEDKIEFWAKALELLDPCPRCKGAPGKHPCEACGNTGRNQQAVTPGAPGEDRQLWTIKPNP